MMRTTGVLAFVTLLLCGCANDAARPDLGRLYSTQRGSAAPPVIVIHGVLGGRLSRRDGGGEVWPGTLLDVAFSDYRELALPIDAQRVAPGVSDLVVSGITDRTAGRDFYGRILDTLTDIGGYRQATPGTPAASTEKRVYVYAYDWRQDNVESVRGLDRLIEQVRSDYSDPQLKVDIVAHSMGGLIARYFIRYGTDDVLDSNEFPVNYDGARKVRRVALLGTPNLGSIASLQALLDGKKIVFGRIDSDVIATFPSAYQVLPHALRDWLVDGQGEPIDADIFDVEWWREHELSIFDPDIRARLRTHYGDAADARLITLERYFHRYLERGRRFSWSLTVPAPHVKQRYVVFGGSCKLTPARGLLEHVDGRWRLRFDPDDVAQRRSGVDYARLLLEPGDGTVTKSSLLARQILDPTVSRHRYSFFPLGYAIFLCEDHTLLTGNLSFQDNLLNALLSADPL